MSPRKATIWFDLDGVLANWNRHRDLGYDPNGPGFYLGLEPFSEGVALFRRLCLNGHLVMVASTAPWDNIYAWTEKRLWVEKHLESDGHKGLTLTHRKDLLSGDYLIDDRTKNGAGEFAGKLVLFGSEEFPDWTRVEQYFVSEGLL